MVKRIINQEQVKLHTISILNYYENAKTEVMTFGYEKEVRWAERVKFENMTVADFIQEYIWVVCNSGMKNQVAEMIFHKYMESKDLDVIRHPHKRHSIEQLLKNASSWFRQLQDKETDFDKLEYLQTLPHIGPTTRYHLAKNLGIQVSKPDRHLVRVAARFGFKNPQELCEFISKQTGDNIITVDVVIWRYCNLRGSY